MLYACVLFSHTGARTAQAHRATDHCTTSCSLHFRTNKMHTKKCVSTMKGNRSSLTTEHSV